MKRVTRILIAALVHYQKALIIIAIALTISCAEGKKKSWETANLKGPIRTVSESTHDAFEEFGESK